MTPARNEEPASGAIAFVVFGVTGDLTRRKLIPALYELALSGRLPQPLYILGFARRDWSDEFLRETLREAVVSHARTQPISQPALERLLANAYYIRSTFEDLEGYQRLASLLKSLRIDHVLYYLATLLKNM